MHVCASLSRIDIQKKHKCNNIHQDDMNVVVADWQNGASIPYEQATANTRVVGAQIAQLINMLSSLTGADNRSFHIIGHSLGAHTAGYAGERVSHLGRISGKDSISISLY